MLKLRSIVFEDSTNGKTLEVFVTSNHLDHCKIQGNISMDEAVCTMLHASHLINGGQKSIMDSIDSIGS